MTELKSYQKILAQPLAFWAASSNKEKVPDAVRCTGLSDVTAVDTITFFIPEKFSGNFIKNVAENPKITLMGCSITTFESYQYKGVYRSMRTATKEEEALQTNYVIAFTDELEKIGFDRGIGEMFLLQPSFAVTFRVTEIYEQTPFKGTGNQVK